MRRCFFANCWAVALAAATFAFGQDRTGQEVNDTKTAEKLAREAFEEVFEIPDDAIVAVLEKNGMHGRFEVKVLLNRMPDGCFGTERKPTAWVKANGDVKLCVWRLDAPGKDLPEPSAIAQAFIFGKKKDPDTAIVLIRRWLEANRERDDYSVHFDDAYARLTWVYREAQRTDEMVETLESELAKAKNPKARYAIYQELARWYASEKQIEKAVECWELARDSMKDGTHAWFVTRRALPFREIGKLWLSVGKENQAVKYLEAFRDTEYVKGTLEVETAELLGDIYERRKEWGKAAALYKSVLTYDPSRAASPQYVERLLDGFRARLQRLPDNKKTD
ncbi:MAG: tetratricopeptide repeat protein [Planctomycetes bacterium]|nr:tetratricopeptide repeat protein [Planctomycetota bacterium]MBL7038747.1 tetratricopeptide repeat protein [Pirellulaceae bacterium]